MIKNVFKKFLKGFAIFIAGTIIISTIIVIFCMIFGIDLPQPEKTEKNVSVTSNTNNDKKKINSKISDYNNFINFNNSYFSLEPGVRTEIWDKEINGKTVVWDGYFVEGFNKRLKLYGFNDYKNQAWTELGDQNLYHKSFTAKFNNKIDYLKYQNGDRIKIKGILDSRGSDNPNYHWELHDAEIIE
ncbi:hypothetical protein [Macrococcus armenti]|uniref:hypothetical protein n=1 Tax=Macrococcus armenti TaxID=2875764 RepID=UPI001CD5FC0F|nr:hypothetical protein [Macrococcus armenti]UBH10639.1 hypothetical protein LAU38_10430 [Macrococcus armenti]